ncbi:MAG TPA: ATP-binding protein [Thermomicrobiaceae bacterium]|nr:ATP-binding protein [Thermomicrobiaceae bacterium]
MEPSADGGALAAVRSTAPELAPTTPVFQALIEHHLDAIALLDADGVIRYASPSVERVLGYPAASVVGANHFDLMHPSDRDEARPRFRMLVAAPGRVGRGRFRLRHRDGSWRWIEGTSTNLFDDPAVRAILSTFQDVTDRLREEERREFLDRATAVLVGSLDYAATLQQVAELAVPLVADWTTVHVVEADGRLHRVGIAHVDPAKQELLARLPGAEWATQPTNSLQRVFQTGVPACTFAVEDKQLDRAAADDEHRRLFAVLQPRSSMVVPLLARGRPLGVLSVVLAESGRRYTAADLPFVTDLARRAALAVDNARLFHEAEQARRFQEEFLSTAAHELKTPLTSIVGYAQLLSREMRQASGTTGRLAGRVDRLRGQVDRLQALVADLLDASQLQQGRLELRRERFDLVELVREVAAREEAAAKGSDRLHVAAVGPAVGCWDRARLDQVVTNLLTNALKYSDATQSVHVSVAAETEAAVLTVRDRGIGIAADDRERIFQPFARAAAGSHLPGTGLGLYISRRIVERHGGVIGVESEPGKGSTFAVRLPLDAPAGG